MFTLQFDRDGIRLTLKQPETGLLKRVLGASQKRNLDHLAPTDRALILALADLRALAENRRGELDISPTDIRLSHRLAAELPGESADTLGLPPIADLTLKTDVEGIVGAPNFRLRAEWFRNGQKQVPQRIGAILQTSAGLRRLPLWLMDAVEVAETFSPGGTDVEHWGALARFRQALDPGTRVEGPDLAARVSMTDFLSGLNVRLADRLSISVNAHGNDFEVIPFDARSLCEDAEGRGFSEGDGELAGRDLQTFQHRVRERGALPAYRLSPGSYLVVERSAIPALAVMADMQHASRAEREAFIRNPRARIAEAVEAALRKEGRLDDLSPEAEEEAIESAAGPLFIETREFSERVTAITAFERPDLGAFTPCGTTWLPEQFAPQIAKSLSRRSTEELLALRGDVQDAIESGEATIPLDELSLPARPEMIATINHHLEQRSDRAGSGGKPENETFRRGPLVLDGELNIDEIRWEAKVRPRMASLPTSVPSYIRTPLKAHQIAGFEWQVAAWTAGLPGILNADEQGLGKTLQTIAFLVWLKAHMAQAQAAHRGPVLVVAPTSLLKNWEQEVATHVEEPGLGHLIRLYGSAVSARKRIGRSGVDTESGEAKLDLDFLGEAIREARAHRFWMLTTYTTLTNYQHSLGRIPFSAIVFDEIQALKNPASLSAQAALFMNADFRIGLTGTPIENSAVDLWAIVEQLAAGAIGSLKDFRRRYGTPDRDNMADLHLRVFKPAHDRPPLARRRTKEEAARDLPEKLRRLHPRVMPNEQAQVYDDARLKLAQGGLGAALKMLHHIRSVSVHPGLDATASDRDLVAASARLSATFDILRAIAAKRERVLVFIEHRRMQYRFIELARAEFGLNRIDLINGDTPIPLRQSVVNRFQQHLTDESRFDILVLGPKAAGVGLTLTAATHVIHLSRWWNPAVEEQCNDRVHRIGQTKPVSIHLPLAIHGAYRENSFDCLLHSLMQRKRKLAESALWPMGDTQGDVAELQKILSQRQAEAFGGDPVEKAMEAMFKRDDFSAPSRDTDGSYLLS